MTRNGMTRREVLVALGASACLGKLSAGSARTISAQASVDIEDLLSRMTVEEKAGQLSLFASAQPNNPGAAANPVITSASLQAQLQAARAGRLTGIFNGANVHYHAQLQAAAMQSRLRIPLLFAADVIHGFTTIFPVPLAEAASFEPELARRTARAAAVEASAVGIDWTFAPMVDIARDARWGRSVEGSGEDSLLGQRMAAARVQGFQGDHGLHDPTAIAACPKHFCGYGAAEGGLDYNTVDVSERTLRQTYFPPFQAAFAAGAATTMAAFNEISGIPATGNAWLLRQVLRDEWDFKGVVVSDYTGDLELVAHGFASTPREAARLALLAGVDISMQSGVYLEDLPSLVASGEVPLALVDAAVRRVLQLKAHLGLFADPFQRLRTKAPARQRSPATLQLAREAARKSIVLLKNDHQLLPLPNTGQRIAVIGPAAQDADNPKGPWALFAGKEQGNDLASGIRAAVAAPEAITVVPGCDYHSALPGGIAAAEAAAEQADVVILAIGESRDDSGEARSQASIALPPAQMDLIRAVAAKGKPMIAVVATGRALALGDLAPLTEAIIVSWLLGSASAEALADILFGRHGPSGRLPVSFPRHPGQVPYYYDHKATGRPDPAPTALTPYTTHFTTLPNTALFPFGHGLTYGQITYESLDLGQAKLTQHGQLRICAVLHNHGSRAAEEVAQLYVHDRAASITSPVQRLVDFKKVHMKAGERCEVEFNLRRDDLQFIGIDQTPTVEPGIFDVWVAPSAEVQGLTGTFELEA